LKRNEREATSESAVRSQPNSFSIGLMKTPNADRTPEAARDTIATAPTTTQA
jgi:hypothetical protein